MRERRLLFVDASHLTAYCWRSGALTNEGRFSASGAGPAEFVRYLGTLPRSVFYLLAELADEGFELDDIPFVRGRDRSALVERKLGQHFYGSPLSLALPLGREKSGRRDEKLLFAALTRPQQVEPWLDALREQKSEVKGIYSLPLLIGTLAAARMQAARVAPLLVVTITSGGLRQTFFDKGTLRFSRLTALPGADLSLAPATCAVESTKIHQYLIQQRLVSLDAPLSTLVLLHPADIARFREHCHDSEDLHFKFLDLLAESRHSSLKTLPQDSRSELLFMQLVVQKPPLLQFAPANLRRYYRLGQVRLALKSAGALVLLMCLLYASMELFDYRQQRDETEATRLLTERDSQRYAAILKTLPPLPTSIDNLRALITRYDELDRQSALPFPVYQRISRAMDQIPSIQLNRIDWRASADPEEGTGTPERKASSAAAKLSVVADLYGQLPTALASDQRALLAAIEGFSNELRKDGELDVRTLKLPFDIESSKSLKSGSGNAPAGDAFGFVLRVSQRR